MIRHWEGDLVAVLGGMKYGPEVRPCGSVGRYEVRFVIRCREGDLVAVLRGRKASVM